MIYSKILPVCLFICFQLLANAQTPLPIKQLLQAPYMKGSTFSLVVKETGNGKSIYRYDTDRQVSPASVLKTVATSTALEILGEEYRFPTSLEYDGTIKNGVLKGNLYIKGSGDPSLGSSHFAPGQNQFLTTWIEAIREAGIRKIEGSVLSDESIFDTEGSSVKWVREDMGNYYAPGCYGISVFDNLYKLTLSSGPAGSQPTIKGTDPALTDMQFHNYLKATPVTSDSAYIIGAPLSNERYLYGVMPANRESYVIKGDIPDPALFMAAYLTKQLAGNGIQVDGSPSCWRIEEEKGTWNTAERKHIVTTYSPTLAEIASICNHVSHNLFADALVKTLGLRYTPGKYEAISSFDRGIRVIRDYWQQKGFDTSTLRINDGSGLAPADKVTATFITDMLVYMTTSSKATEAFTASLPQAGIEGSVRNFLKGTKLQGKARLKSGGITGVRSYAGYITIGKKQYAVAVFSNNYTCPMAQMTKGLEKLLLQLFEPLGQ